MIAAVIVSMISTVIISMIIVPVDDAAVRVGASDCLAIHNVRFHQPWSRQ